MTVAPPAAFADPVAEAQAAFRALLDATARPGETPAVAPPGRLSGGGPGRILPGTLATVLLALADHTTPVFLDRALAAEGVVGPWLAFHAGAPIAADPTEAVFAAVADPRAMPPLDAFPPGTDAAPERSATLLIALATLSDGPPLTLSGPGIDGTRALGPAPLPADFVAAWSRNAGLFPRGVDLVLAAGGRIACLPRTTRIAEA